MHRSFCDCEWVDRNPSHKQRDCRSLPPVIGLSGQSPEASADYRSARLKLCPDEDYFRRYPAVIGWAAGGGAGVTRKFDGGHKMEYGRRDGVRPNSAMGVPFAEF